MKADGEVPSAWTLELTEALGQFYTPDRLIALANLIIEHLIGLRANDLEVGQFEGQAVLSPIF